MLQILFFLALQLLLAFALGKRGGIILHLIIFVTSLIVISKSGVLSVR